MSPWTSLDAAQVMLGEMGKLGQEGSHQCWPLGEGEREHFQVCVPGWSRFSGGAK